MNVKIRGGTVTDGDAPLCQTCRFATIVSGARLRDEFVECAALSYGYRRITFRVFRCSRYSDKRQPSLRDMESVAWILRSDPRRNEIGFIRSSKLSEEERYVLSND